MKNILLTILGMIILIPQLSIAEEEIVWQLEGIGIGIGDIIVSNTQNTFLNTHNSTIQIRSIDDGLAIDSINLKSYFNSIDKISISNDDRFLAISGEGKYLLIWDLENNREYRKISKVVFDGDSAHSWKSVSISPDGRKITAIAVIEPAGVTELVVFDLVTEEVLLSEFRQWTDQIDFEDYTPIWISTEFSPSGDYIVTELSINWTTNDGERRFYDSVYVYKTSNYNIESTLLNAQSDKDITFSSLENIICSRYGGILSIYNLDTREAQEIYLERKPYSVLFSRTNSSKVLLSLGTRAYIYDYSNNNELYEYQNNIYAYVITKDNSKIIGHGINGLTCIKTFWTKTSVENYTSQATYYPNPVSNLLNINLNVIKGGQFKYELFDINSIKLASESLNFLQIGLNGVSIDFSPFESQTYYLKIFSAQESFNFKIVKE